MSRGVDAPTSTLPTLLKAQADLIDELRAENERLQRERSEWCDQADRRLTDYMTQQRDLLAENAALRARLTLTPERIEAAALELRAADEQLSGAVYVMVTYREQARAALLAAGMEEEQ